jgi:hypothetical protein
MRLAIRFLLTLAVTACAQTSSSHSGWSFTDTLQTVMDVLVGDIVSGAAATDIRCRCDCREHYSEYVTLAERLRD